MTTRSARLGESAATAALVLVAVTPPAAWDTTLAAGLTVMSFALTAGVYALHAVTFDCFRMTGHRDSPAISYTQREE